MTCSSPFQDKASLLKSVYVARDSCVHTVLRQILLHSMAALACAQFSAVYLCVGDRRSFLTCIQAAYTAAAQCLTLTDFHFVMEPVVFYRREIAFPSKVL